MSSFAPEVLEAYVRFGFEDLSDGTVRLRCRGEYEARTYEHAARNKAYSGLGQIACPVVIACGSDSYGFIQPLLGLVAGQIGSGRLEMLDGLGHFAPLEQPASVADSIIRALDPPPA